MGEQPELTPEDLAAAEQCAALEFTAAERELMLDGVRKHVANYQRLREVALPNSVAPALRFDPGPPSARFDRQQRPLIAAPVEASAVPADLEELAFAPLTRLAALVRSRSVTSVELTEMYLRRLKRYDPALWCVITLTEDLALEQARRADEEIAGGRYRGPLHGIPWGAKDLLATRGIRTTWGAEPFQEQIPDDDATVVARLHTAGAVLVAKLSMGALAWGDWWYGGQTKNPWNVDEGSSGSSAGSAAATAAGLVGFAIGTETYGSIVSPSARCGVTGLRPTFGRVSRHGAMALSWSMDKIGPICRAVEDCALVFDAIRGSDGQDRTVVDLPFNWDGRAGIDGLRIGYVRAAFEEAGEQQAANTAALDLLRALGAEPRPIDLPALPVEALTLILEVEAAAAFDELTRSDRDELLLRQGKETWPNVFRQARLIPAVEYLQANRVRTLLMEAMARVMDEIDVFVAPPGGEHLLITNLTGHPSVVAPSGWTAAGGPTALTFTANLYGEADALRVAKAMEGATDFHHRRPPMERLAAN